MAEDLEIATMRKDNGRLCVLKLVVYLLLENREKFVMIQSTKSQYIICPVSAIWTKQLHTHIAKTVDYGILM